jgi:hypothetical protein
VKVSLVTQPTAARIAITTRNRPVLTATPPYDIEARPGVNADRTSADDHV